SHEALPISHTHTLRQGERNLTLAGFKSYSCVSILGCVCDLEFRSGGWVCVCGWVGVCVWERRGGEGGRVRVAGETAVVSSGRAVRSGCNGGWKREGRPGVCVCVCECVSVCMRASVCV